MSPLVPRPHADELLYSLLARAWRLAGEPSPGAFAAALFGRRTAVATPDLPCGLAELAPRLGLDLDADGILERLTLYPFHAAFLPDGARRDARARMLAGGKGLHLRLGIAASGVPAPTSLRFCSACLERMLGDHGEAWWRRAHQLPGVCVCPDHDAVLRRGGVVFAQVPRHAYLAADPSTCPTGAPPVFEGLSAAGIGRLRTLARAAATLLEGPPAVRADAEAYRGMLRDAGLMRSAAKVDVGRMQAAYSAHWSDALPAVPGGAPGPWLPALARSRQRIVHPVRHLLLKLCLQAARPVAVPFGAGPWECMNPLAAHRGRKVVRGFRCVRDHGKATATFSCGCGYVYTRRLDGGIIGPPRFKVYGALLEPALRRELAAPGATRRGVASSLRLDAKTMMRLVHDLGLAHPWPEGPACVPRPPVPNPTAPPTPSRGGTAGRTPSRATLRHDWDALDEATCAHVGSARSAILAEMGPVRVTIAEIERRLGGRGSLRRRRHRLPASWELARSIVESGDAFRRRRVAAAIDRLAPGDRRAWRVMREAGVGGVAARTMVNEALMRS